jgi:hypothetical protein
MTVVLDQGEFVLARNLKIDKQVSRYLDISLLILYNYFHFSGRWKQWFEPRPSASASC